MCSWRIFGAATLLEWAHAFRYPCPGAGGVILEIEVSEKLRAQMSVHHSKKGSGKLVFSYNNLDELDGILKHIR